VIQPDFAIEPFSFVANGLGFVTSVASTFELSHTCADIV
jgi:hypothetical protein